MSRSANAARSVGTQQTRGHFMRGHRRHAAAQQHAHGAIQARELVQPQLPADGRQFRNPAAKAARVARRAIRATTTATAATPNGDHGQGMRVQHLAPVQQQARRERQVRPRSA